MNTWNIPKSNINNGALLAITVPYNSGITRMILIAISDSWDQKVTIETIYNPLENASIEYTNEQLILSGINTYKNAMLIFIHT